MRAAKTTREHRRTETDKDITFIFFLLMRAAGIEDNK